MRSLDAILKFQPGKPFIMKDGNGQSALQATVTAIAKLFGENCWGDMMSRRG